MPKAKEKKRVEAHLLPDEYKEFHADALEKDWSDKKLNEHIIRIYLKELKEKKQKATNP